MVQSRTANYYDALKCVALVAMTLDHFGFFFFPEQDWLRIVGRAAAPIFLLFVGYNGSFKFRRSLFYMAALVTVADGLLIPLWLPLNILWTIVLVRMVLAYALPRFAHHEIAIVSVVAIPFTMPLLDFGSLALLFALIGHRLAQARDRFVALWLIIGIVLFGIYSYHVILADASMMEALMLITVLSLTGWVLWCADYKKPVTFAPYAVMLLATSSLYYYAGHKIVLEVLRLL